jgi:hypothetical protein
MALRNRGYYREQRQKHINRKKRIIKEQQYPLFWGYKHEGELSKGKIHCSCWMCRQKTYDNWKHSDKQRIEEMEFELKDNN